MEKDKIEIWQLVISAFISIIVSFIVYKFSAYFDTRKELKFTLENRLNEILSIAVQYPYLENKECTEKWVENSSCKKGKFQRYDLYCTMLFNYLAQLADYHNYSLKRIEKDINFSEWVFLHQQYWNNSPEGNSNEAGYNEKFRKLVNTVLNNRGTK